MAVTAADPVAARGITSALSTGVAPPTRSARMPTPTRTRSAATPGVVTGVLTEFVHARAACYRTERRWGTAFWLRRRRPR